MRFCHMPQRLAQRIGRRGYSLLFLGTFDLFYALSLPGATTFHTPASLWLARLLPLDAWAGIWACVGVILIMGAFRIRDEWAFAIATLLKLMWSLIFLVGWIVNHVERGWASAIVWAAFASWVLIISTWPELTPYPTRGKNPGGGK